MCENRCFCFVFFSSRRRHTRCALVTGVQTCALPIFREGAMKLTDLEAKFVIRTENGFHSGDDVTIENAQGLWYLCPQCYAKNGGARSTHQIGRASCRERVCQSV